LPASSVQERPLGRLVLQLVLVLVLAQPVLLVAAVAGTGTVGTQSWILLLATGMGPLGPLRKLQGPHTWQGPHKWQGPHRLLQAARTRQAGPRVQQRQERLAQ